MYAGLNSTCAEVTSTEETKGRIYFCNLGFVEFIHKSSEIPVFCVILLKGEGVVNENIFG